MKTRALLVTGLLLALDAAATPNFPPAVKRELALSAEPQCTLCHQGVTAVGTVTTPFGKALRQRGLSMYDEGSLRAAIASSEADSQDSDGDGTGDIAELRAGDDPNLPAPGAEGGAGGPSSDEREVLALGEPTYGCSSADAVTDGRGLPAIAWAFLTLLGRRRSARTCGRSAPPAAF